MKKKGGKRIATSQIELGPIRHGTLPPELLSRIEDIARIFAEVNGQPATEWVKDFRRDLNPEKEIIIWEAMAATYSVFTKRRKQTLAAKKEVYGLLLMNSMQDAASMLDEIPLKHLNKADAVLLLGAFDSLAIFDGPDPGSSPPDVHPSPASRAAIPSVPATDESFTIRDEANALTALAFRNGFIEELHAGKWSPLLDDPGYSRITDDEMRRLMIEASEMLAKMLNLKQSDPAQYDARVRDYNGKYCRTWKR